MFLYCGSYKKYDFYKKSFYKNKFITISIELKNYKTKIMIEFSIKLLKKQYKNCRKGIKIWNQLNAEIYNQKALKK